MRLYRTGSLFDVTLPVLQYRASVIDNVERVFVGDNVHLLKRGDVLHQTTVTVRDTYSAIQNLRRTLLYYQSIGKSFRINLEEHEPLFGPEFSRISLGQIQKYYLLQSSDDAYVTDHMPDDIVEWTFTFGPSETILPCLKFKTETEMPDGLRVIGVSRVQQQAVVTHRQYYKQSGDGFVTQAPAFTVQYEAPRQIVEKAKGFLLMNAISGFVSINFGARTYVRIDMEPDQAIDCFVLSIDDFGAIARGSDEFAFSVTYGSSLEI